MAKIEFVIYVNRNKTTFDVNLFIDTKDATMSTRVATNERIDKLASLERYYREFGSVETRYFSEETGGYELPPKPAKERKPRGPNKRKVKSLRPGETPYLGD